MKLTSEQIQQLGDKILSLNPKMHCPFCNNNQLTTSQNGEIYILPKFGDKDEAGLISYDLMSPMPLVPIYCSKCGYTAFFNPVVLGLISPKA